MHWLINEWNNSFPNQMFDFMNIFCTCQERFSVSYAISCLNTWKLFVKSFHINEALLWNIAGLWGQMPQSLYFCTYVGCEEHAAFAGHVFYPLTVHRVLCYSLTDGYQIYWNASCHWKKYALPSGRQYHKIRYVSNVQVIAVIKYKILFPSWYIYIISCSNIIKSTRLVIILLIV